MNQMVHSNQMRKVSIEPQDYGSHYFLPHHAVVKESSTTTRVRPVFNASARNAAGHSLNENLLTGPNLLPQLVLVLAHWRCYPIAFVADVSKMSLQVRLHPEDWKLQSILWREDPRKSIEYYVLTTVTFGCGPSAYLASRTLRKLAEDDGNKFPLVPPIVHHEMYMDDVLSGAFDLNTESEKRRHLCSLFSAGGFSLAKWMTNDPELLNVASRGCPVSVLREDRLWWNGPETLSSTTVPWPNNCDDFSQIVPKETEEAESNVLVQSSDAPPDCDLILRYSSYRRLSKILAHCLRFVTKLAQRCERPLTVQFQAAANVEVSVEELEQAERHLCRMTQNALLSVEIKCISAKTPYLRAIFLPSCVLSSATGCCALEDACETLKLMRIASTPSYFRQRAI
ncbi:unnamed protein product [Trichogramma brassicae]|uniref:Reverse transcriptase domain-containing protein n=1 Tax=Trichogramma brassicae TaxID=86971 RepID=A0A6H5IXR7_9HYME|nr:unnamed protein product [Trichogramma brassicae]